ncbi:hypothetical protein BX600DRAFT_437790 [Xylariales sp. PMI_506]|nr:hypothetical protein BX600DRAFT_437790 [Xylariales sp. PMI_506]
MHDPVTTRGSDIDTVTRWEPEQNPFVRVAPNLTLFTRSHFTAWEQHSDGLADIVGYWAEDRILGGVVLFDRSQNWAPDNEPNVYFQCCRRKVTYCICQLLDEQQESLLGFLQKSDGPLSECPLLILPNLENRVRIEPVAAISGHKVYRDIWERATPPRRLRMQQYMEPDVANSLDFPEHDIDEEVRRLRQG